MHTVKQMRDCVSKVAITQDAEQCNEKFCFFLCPRHTSLVLCLKERANPSKSTRGDALFSVHTEKVKVGFLRKLIC